MLRQIDYFLQRYKTDHSLAEELDPRYLSRNKYKLELKTNFKKYEGYLTFIKNIRSIKSETFYSNEWDKISFKFGQAMMMRDIFHHTAFYQLLLILLMVFMGKRQEKNYITELLLIVHA